MGQLKTWISHVGQVRDSNFITNLVKKILFLTKTYLSELIGRYASTLFSNKKVYHDIDFGLCWEIIQQIYHNYVITNFPNQHITNFPKIH